MPFKLNPFTDKLDYFDSGGFYENEFEILAQTLQPSTSWIKEITLPSDDFQQGYLLMYIPSTASYSKVRRHSATVMFTTDVDDCIASITRRKGEACGCGYYVYVWRQEGWSFDVDGKLGEVSSWRTYGAGQLYIRKVWIEGDKLKIEFQNTHGTYTVRIDIRGKFHVFN